jgi:hypothetical protein
LHTLYKEYVMDHHHHPAAPATTAATSLQELLQHLRAYEGELPEAIRRPLVTAGATVVPALIALVESALADDRVDLGWAPLHAVDLLGALGDARAVPVLLRCLDQEDDLDLLVQQAAAALHALGVLALDSCVAAYTTTPRDAFRDRLAGVMSRWGLHDERIYTALLDTLQRTPELGANDLVEYGEARALSVLAQTSIPCRSGRATTPWPIMSLLSCAVRLKLWAGT